MSRHIDIDWGSQKHYLRVPRRDVADIAEALTGLRAHGLPWLVIDTSHNRIVASFASQTLAGRVAAALNDLEATI